MSRSEDRAAQAPKANILKASAGAGKTYRLAYEYILSAIRNHRYTDADGEDRFGFDEYIYREILAVTFTNKATAEMKSRILGQIDTLASGRRSDYLERLLKDTGLEEKEIRKRALRLRTRILHDYSHFTILTNDTFFQRILRAFVKELGMEMNFSIELDGSSILDEGANRIIDDTENDSKLESWIMEFSREMIEDGKGWDIKRGILSLQDEIFKEEIRSSIEGGVNRETIWKEVSEFIRRTEAQVASIRTDRDAILGNMTASGYGPADLGRKKAFLERITRYPLLNSRDFTQIDEFASGDIDDFIRKEELGNPALHGLMLDLQQVAQRMISVQGDMESCRLLRRNFRSFALMQDLYRRAMDICREDNTMLLSETKHIISSFISEQDAPFIYEKVGNRFSRFMIDEFQDTSVQEWRNFLPLLREAMSKCEETSVLLVGDVKQSIYRWRGGDWKILGEEAQRDLEKDSVGRTATSSIDDNWRSRSEIVSFNNRLFERIVSDENTTLNGLVSEGRSTNHLTAEEQAELTDAVSNAYSTLQQRSMLRSDQHGYISVTELEKDEEPDVKGLIDRLIDEGYRPCDITILVRTKREGDRIVRNIASSVASRSGTGEGTGHDFDIMTQDALGLWKSRAVQFITATMSAAADRKDAVSMAIFKATVCHDLMRDLADEEAAFLDSIQGMSPEEAFESIINMYGHLFPKATAYIQALHELILRHSFSQTSDLSSWNQWWNENKFSRSVTAEKSEDTVEIMTIHKAKGLENRIIIIPYCTWSLDPMPNRTTIWARPDRRAGVTSLGRFPVPFSAAVKDSIFSAEYYRETIFSHVDAINTLYVAFTRPTERLYAFIPRKKGETIGKMLTSVLRSFQGTESGTPLRFVMGEEDRPMSRPAARGSGSTLIETYCSTPSSSRLRLSTDRYLVDDGRRMSPRSEGIALHRAFQNSESEEDIIRSIARMEADGDLSPTKAESLRLSVRSTLSREPYSEWFSGKWDKVLNESGILADSMTHRPDRVMISGGRAVVVDYKFGRKEAAHAGQILQYMTLLRRMGYTDVSGYIWYVSTEEITSVE